MKKGTGYGLRSLLLNMVYLEEDGSPRGQPIVIPGCGGVLCKQRKVSMLILNYG